MAKRKSDVTLTQEEVNVLRSYITRLEEIRDITDEIVPSGSESHPFRRLSIKKSGAALYCGFNSETLSRFSPDALRVTTMDKNRNDDEEMEEG